MSRYGIHTKITTITHHMSYLQSLIYLVIVPQVIVNTTYLIFGYILLFLDMYRPLWYHLLTYKLDNRLVLETMKPSLDTLVDRLFKNVFISMAIGCLMSASKTELVFYEPCVYTILKLAITVLIADVWFYFSHRLMHTQWLYQKVHYMHHQAANPNAFTTNYCHWVEFIFVNMITILIGPVITQMALSTFYVWVFLFTMFTQYEHCGVYLHHFKHHVNIKGNYGLTVLLDRLLNTEQ